MQKEVSPKITALIFGVLTVSFLAAFYVVAWQEPTEAPPGGNVATPLNVSITGQAKEGGLILNTGGAENALIIDKGKSKFGGPLILYPMNRPSPPEEGQMYFDQIDKYLYYFNGTDWVRIGVETITGCGVCRF